jgi:hypothetical protein
MPVSELARKLGIRPGSRVLILNPPHGYKSMLEPLPRDAEMLLGGTGPFDVVQCFVASQAELAQRAPLALNAAGPGAWVWMCYPKKSSKVRTDLSRRDGWEPIRAAGWENSAVESIDETWSAVRVRPARAREPHGSAAK